jgi:hypothetical protein
MIDLTGKQILLIAPIFFGYELEIIKEIERRGAKVDYIADRPFDKPWQKALNRIAPAILRPHIEILFAQKLALFNTQKYDIIFVIKGLTLSLNMHEELKRLYPTAYKILYMWDSMKNCLAVSQTLQLYDATFSFDPEDAQQYKMKMRPLFFTKGFEQKVKLDNFYDVSFIGTMHSDRYGVLKKIRNNLSPTIKDYWYLYLQARWVYFVYKISKSSMRGAIISEFKFTPADKVEVLNVFKNSKCIVDIEHPKQRGLTMRTFEALGANKKIITTNQQICNYEFYNENNILIVDRNTPYVPDIFLKSEYKPINSILYRKYSIAGWLDEVLNLNATQM